ncbi:MAG: hypothetical protein WA431_00805 [Candidatus Cybelea sp.]|jgi:hypothetical protein
MKIDIRSFALLLPLVALGATGTPATVTVQASNISFRDAFAACPAGTMASMSFSLSHLRIAPAPGVESDIDDANPNAQVIMLTGEGKATVTVNAAKHTVTAKHVTLVSARRAACIAPE